MFSKYFMKFAPMKPAAPVTKYVFIYLCVFYYYNGLFLYIIVSLFINFKHFANKICNEICGLVESEY